MPDGGQLPKIAHQCFSIWSASLPRRYAAPSSWNQAAMALVAPKLSPSPTRPSAVSISSHIAPGTRSNRKVRSETIVESMARSLARYGGLIDAFRHGPDDGLQRFAVVRPADLRCEAVHPGG